MPFCLPSSEPFCCRKEGIFKNAIIFIGILDAVYNILLYTDVIRATTDYGYNYQMAEYIFHLINMLIIVLLFIGIRERKSNFLLPYFFLQINHSFGWFVFGIISFIAASNPQSFCGKLISELIMIDMEAPIERQSIGEISGYLFLTSIPISIILYIFAIVAFIYYFHLRNHQDLSVYNECTNESEDFVLP